MHKKTKGTHAFEFPIFKEFGENSTIKFLIASWNSNYDCLIGDKDLKMLKAKIDYENELFSTPNFEINYFKNKPDICKGKEINNHEINIKDKIRTSHMNEEGKSKILKLCQTYADCFYQKDKKLTSTNATSHCIRVKSENPIYVKSFRYPYHLKEEIQNEIRKLIKDEVIRPSNSPYSSPVWIIPKKIDASGKRKYRMVIDYRKLNENTIDDRYPLPRMEDILENLGKCSYFSTLDLAQGFHQIPLHSNSIEKTAFTVENGHYEYIRMPFGLKNAPASFQRMMDKILMKYLYKFCFVYMDDIVIFSKSLQEHLQHIKLIFEELKQFNLKMQLDKSEFLRKEVPFLGHIITSDGIKPNPEKIKAIVEYPIPKTQKEIKAFLGLSGYYRKCIKDYAKITKPLTNALRKGEAINIKETNYIEAFNKCKELITNAPILQYPDFDKKFHITSDASNVAVGAVLSQEGHPISFFSRTLNSAEQNYSTIEKELLAIVEACRHFRSYVYGRKFVIEKDHKPLTWLWSLKTPNSKLIRWRIKLEEYDYEVKYRKGCENHVADGLSRVEINALESDNDEDDLVSMIPQNSENEQHSNESCADDETMHTSEENPSFTLPITDKNIHAFTHSIIIKDGRDYDLKIIKDKVKRQVIVKINKFNSEAHLIKFFNENLESDRL
ncbi:hypothetical protein TKK_0009902 [Trichogramma kaykai]